MPPHSLEHTYFPLGFALRIATNSRAILEAADKNWRRFTQCFPEPAVTVRIEVSAAGPAGLPPAPAFRAHRNLVGIVADAANFAVCDTDQRLGVAWLTPAVAGDAPYLRYYFLDAMAHQLITTPWLTPVHAACVARAGRGLLLCGEPGAGKSSLAYACARRGWTYLSDDASYMLRGSNNRGVIGNPHQIRFRPGAAGVFPELAGRLPAHRGNGEMTIEVWTDELEGISTAAQCAVERILFLKRRPVGAPRVLPIAKAEALRRLEWVVYHWQPRVAEEQQASLKNLVTAETCDLEYSDLDAAVDCLESFARPPEDSTQPR